MKLHWSLVGQWYLRRDTYELLQVLDYDEESGTISVQNFEGDLDQFDDESWRALPLEPAEPPEDWTGPLDNVELEDLDEFVATGHSQPEEPFADYREPWENISAEEAIFFDTGHEDFIRESADDSGMKQPIGPGSGALQTASTAAE
jgi:hypothetical protein